MTVIDMERTSQTKSSPVKPITKDSATDPAKSSATINDSHNTIEKSMHQPSKKAGDIKISEEQRRGMIAEAAYYRAERRGSTNGDPVDDWLAAEVEVDLILSNG